MEEYVCLLAVNGHIGSGALCDGVGRGGYILVVLVLLWRLRWICLDGLRNVSFEPSMRGLQTYSIFIQIGIRDRKLH